DDALPFGVRVRLGTTAFRQDSYCQSAAFSADGKVLAGVSEQQGVYLWETATGRRLRKLDCPATCVALSPSGTALAIGVFSRRGEGAVLLWDWRQQKELIRWRLPADFGLERLAFTPDGGRLLCQSPDGSLRAWDIWTGRETILWKSGGPARTL